MQSGYQFIHIETYARYAGKNKRSAIEIGLEAEREPDHCTHIADPKPYVMIHGCTPTEAVTKATKLAELAKDTKGRKLRKDAQVIVIGVASYPKPVADLDPDDQDFKNWVQLNHEFLLKKYGNNYVSSIGHFSGDERFPHIHFYIIPELREDNQLDMAAIHPGIKAQRNVTENSRKKKITAYSEAMRAFQDDYYNLVGQKAGLCRDGPKRRRLTRKEWILEKNNAIRTAAIEQKASKLKDAFAEIKSLKHDLKKRFAQLQHKENRLASLIERAQLARWTKNKHRNNESYKDNNNETELRL